MSEIERITDQMTRAYEGNAWHGPALRELLTTVTAETAAAKPLADRHSIWEIVLHVAAWKRVAARRLKGETVKEPPEGDWPPLPVASADSWQKSLRHLDSGHRQVLEATSSLSDKQLEEKTPGTDYTLYFLAHGAIQHDLYHAGQIALLRRKP
jgi:uncharacterized damage-inducible protein DinB